MVSEQLPQRLGQQSHYDSFESFFDSIQSHNLSNCAQHKIHPFSHLSLETHSPS